MFAEIPGAKAAPSLWRACHGFHLRLHVHHRTRHTAGLTLSLVRESTSADVRIDIRLQLFSDDVQKPVRNLSLASKESLPRERHITIQLPARVASKSVRFLPIAVPRARFVVAVSLDVQECFIEVAGRLGTVADLFERSDFVQRFSDAFTTKGTIQWLGEEEEEEEKPHCSAAHKDENDVREVEREHNSTYDDATVPYDLSTLLESSSSSEHSCRQPTDSTFSDVTLVVGSGFNTSRFHLHRCILALASPVFRAMLTSDMLERHTGTVRLPNFTPGAVHVAVRHIYGAQVDVKRHAFELYQFAHQLDIVSLRSAAKKAILHEIELRTCVHILRFGVAFQDDNIVGAASLFLSSRFSELVGDTTTASQMHHIPTENFFQLLEDDTITATELEILLTALQWLSINKGAAVEEVFRRIRWELMAPDVLDLVHDLGLGAFVPETPALPDTTESSVMKEVLQSSHIVRRRTVGKPNATLWVPLISKPPTAFALPSVSANHTKPRKRPRVCVEVSKPVETTFEHAKLRWAFRAKLDDCNWSTCCKSRLSASLWLEEDDNGKVWTDGSENALPVHVSANIMVWNSLGGQLHVVPIRVAFRSAGWANGWCVMDLFHGQKAKLASLGDAVQVAIEVREILQAA